MPWGLMRFHHSGQSHFVTLCCYHRGLAHLPSNQLGLPHPLRISEGGSRCSVLSKLRCPLFVASEMSGFKVVPSPLERGWFWGWGCRGRGQFPFPCSSLSKQAAKRFRRDRSGLSNAVHS